jgi:hypothetical protein
MEVRNVSKPSDKIALELTRKEWQEVVDSIDAFSAERQDHSESTNNLRHKKAWMRESEELSALARKVLGGVVLYNAVIKKENNPEMTVDVWLGKYPADVVRPLEDRTNVVTVKE